MGFLSDFITKNGENAAKGVVNIEAVLAKLDEIWAVFSKTKSGLVPQAPNETTATKFLRQDGVWAHIPTYNAFASYTALNIGARGNLSRDGNNFVWTTNSSGNYEIVTLFATIAVGAFIAYHYLAKTVY